MKGMRALRGLSVLILLATVSCGTDPQAKTAQEFVEKYALAYRTHDVNAITRMTVVDTGEAEKCFRNSIRRDIASQGFGYTAWTRTRYVSESVQDSFIMVDVKVDCARSSIVLVRKGTTLKIVQNPSDYTGER